MLYLDVDGIRHLFPHGGTTLRAPWDPDLDPAESIVDAVANIGVAPQMVHSTSWRVVRGQVVLTFLVVIEAPPRRPVRLRGSVTLRLGSGDEKATAATAGRAIRPCASVGTFRRPANRPPARPRAGRGRRSARRPRARTRSNSTAPATFGRPSASSAASAAARASRRSGVSSSEASRSTATESRSRSRCGSPPAARTSIARRRAAFSSPSSIGTEPIASQASDTSSSGECGSRPAASSCL